MQRDGLRLVAVGGEGALDLAPAFASGREQRVTTRAEALAFVRR